MFTVSLNLNKKRKKTVVICGVVLIFMLAAAFTFSKGALFKDKTDSSEQTLAKTVLDTNEKRTEFLKSFGWDISAEPLETVDVQLPSESDEVIEMYNQIQTAQGLDIKKYLGKKAVRYTYEVKNYPGKPENIRANIIMYKDKLIAGDICSIEINGFMHGFKAPEDIQSQMNTQNQ